MHRSVNLKNANGKHRNIAIVQRMIVEEVCGTMDMQAIVRMLVVVGGIT